MDLNEYISPSLSVLMPLLYLIGMALKASSLRDYKIPFILGAVGIVLANIWLFSQGIPATWQAVIVKLLFGTIQGIICAAVSVYTNNLIKQYGKKDEENGNNNENDKTTS